MSELERIKDLEERIALAGLLPGVNLGFLPLEDAAKLKRAALDLYRLSHARGFKSGADHAIKEIAQFIQPEQNASQIQWLKRWLSDRMRERRWTSPRSILETIIRKFREARSGRAATP